MSAIKEVQAPGEGAYGGEAAQYRAGYEAGLRRGAGVRSPFDAGRGGLTAQLWAARSAAWAAGYGRGVDDRAAGVTYARWQASAPKAVPQKSAGGRRRGLEPAPGEQGVRPYQRSAYRRGYAAARAGKTLSDCPYVIAGAGNNDQLTPRLRDGWLQGFRAWPLQVVAEVQGALRQAAAAGVTMRQEEVRDYVFAGAGAAAD